MAVLTRNNFARVYSWGVVNVELALFIAKYVLQSGGEALDLGSGTGFLA